MDLLLSQMTPVPAATDPVDASPVLPAVNTAGETPAAFDASGQAQPGFSDALLNIINVLIGGEQQRDTAMVLAEVKSPDDEQTEKQADATRDINDPDGSPQQLLDALLMASQLPARTLNASATLMPQPGNALTMQNITAGQTTLTTPRAAPAQPALVDVAPEPLVQGIKPAVADITKPLMAMMPATGQPVVPQTFTHASEKQTLNLPSITLDADEAKWAQQLHSALNDRLQLQVRNQVQHATIRLDPPEMGKVDISLQIENGRMQVHISASNGETYRALQQISTELRQSLTEQNFVQVNVQVSSQSGQSQQGREQQHAQVPPESPIAGADIAADEARAALNKDDSVLLTV